MSFSAGLREGSGNGGRLFGEKPSMFSLSVTPYSHFSSELFTALPAGPPVNACEPGVIPVILHTDQVHKNTQPRTSKLPPTNDGNVRSTGALRRHTGFYLRVSGLCTWGVMSAPGVRWEVVMPQVGSTWGCELFCEAPVRPHPPLCAG